MKYLYTQSPTGRARYYADHGPLKGHELVINMLLPTGNFIVVAPYMLPPGRHFLRKLWYKGKT
jgi:hypothetical protein